MDRVFPGCIIILATLAAFVYLGCGNLKLAAFYALTALINWVVIW